MILNDPALVATLAALHDAYEQALTVNDVPALTAFFWDSPHVVRYGVAEQLYGAESVHAYRTGSAPRFSARRLVRREIATFGPDFAMVTAEFEVTVNEIVRPNRQSQTWVRLPELGWRIVSAHVSAPLPLETPWEAYATRVAAALDLPLDPAHRPGVAANLERTAALAAPFLAFPLPDSAEPAPVFTA